PLARCACLPAFATWQGCRWPLRFASLYLPPCLSVGVVAWRQGYGCAQHPHPFGARPSGCAPLRLPVLPLTPLHLWVQVMATGAFGTESGQGRERKPQPWSEAEGTG